MDFLSLLMYGILYGQYWRVNNGYTVAYKTKDGEYLVFHPKSKFALYMRRIQAAITILTFVASMLFCAVYLSESQCIRGEDDERGSNEDELDESFQPTFYITALKYGLVLYYGFFLVLSVLFCDKSYEQGCEGIENLTANY